MQRNTLAETIKGLLKFKINLIEIKVGISTFKSLKNDKELIETNSKEEIEALEKYEGHLESKERFAIQRYLLIIGKKQNMHVLSHTFTYFST